MGRVSKRCLDLVHVIFVYLVDFEAVISSSVLMVADGEFALEWTVEKIREVEILGTGHSCWIRVMSRDQCMDPFFTGYI